jgi:hypothetical protein
MFAQELVHVRFDLLVGGAILGRAFRKYRAAIQT